MCAVERPAQQQGENGALGQSALPTTWITPWGGTRPTTAGGAPTLQNAAKRKASKPSKPSKVHFEVWRHRGRIGAWNMHSHEANWHPNEANGKAVTSPDLGIAGRRTLHPRAARWGCRESTACGVWRPLAQQACTSQKRSYNEIGVGWHGSFAKRVFFAKRSQVQNAHLFRHEYVK
jgi:hypothetical protein